MQNNQKQLEASVKIVAEPWDQSPYYEDAERFTGLFWDEGTLFRQRFSMLQLDTVVELACGHGRHAEQILDQCGQLILMDVFNENLDICRQRLGENQTIRYIHSNGYNFEPVSDESVSSIFCYDAMVHFSSDIIASYLHDAHRILRPGGQMLLHHSNYDTGGNNQHYGLNPHARNHMTYALFQTLAEQAGLNIISSNPLDWGGEKELDRLSLLLKP
ncbi:MAG: class I SAM-dependent methyltransferase [Chromatiaceae bacterium]|nr:class I SAM-dependent methyltransferase [Chromatiaceae bacterium]MCF8002611.1 class I SAM-dependent methyltransferase [Chromatiaceae bacterium]